MKFSQNVVVIAWAMFALSATAETATTQATQSPTNVNVTVNTSASDAAVAAPAATSAPAEQAPVAAPVVAPISAPAAAAVAPAVDASGDKKVDAIKKVRQEVEQKNDNKVVEKLEKTRLDEEKQISEKIETTSLKPTDAPPAQAPVESKPVIVEVIQPAASASSTSTAKIEKEEEKKDEKKIWYGGLGTGSTIYSGNITQKSSLGVMVGKMLDDHMAVEGSFTYSTFNLNNFWNGTINNLVFGDVDQYDLGVAIKYYLFDNERFHPYVGASADYIYRQYKDRYDYGGIYGYDNYTQSQATNSLNAGLLTGVDVSVSSRLMIGAEFRYSMPIYYQDNGLITQSYLMAYAKPIEQTTFTSWLLSVKFLF